MPEASSNTRTTRRKAVLAALSGLLHGSVVLVSRPGGRCLPVVAER
jgi:hypothetical protein